MTASHTAQLGAALLSAAAPLLVAAIVYYVARANARRYGHELAAPHSFRALAVTTVIVGVVASIAAVSIPAPSPWMFAIGLLAFAIPSVPGMRVIGDIDRASLPARQRVSASRIASLTPRRADRHLPWSWRIAIYAVTTAGIALLVLRASTPVAGQQLTSPFVFAFAATMFVLLYESWIHGVVTGPVIDDDSARHRTIVRRIFAAEAVLVVTMLAVAHMILDMNWTTNEGAAAWLSFAGGLVGIAGCALALASGLIGRGYVAANR